MSDLALALRQVRSEQKSFWRNPAAAVFTFAFPLLFLVIFATLNTNETVAERQGISFVTFYVPGIVGFGLIAACYQNLAIRLCVARDLGVLKRVRGTPLPPWIYLVGQFGSSVVTSVILVTLTVVAGVEAYGVHFRTETIPGLVLTLVLGSMCFCSLGVAVTSVVPNGDAAPPLVSFSLFPLLFISGVFFPLGKSPQWLQSLAKIFPIQHLVHALQDVFDPGIPAPGINRSDLGYLILWTVAGTVLALRFFRWENGRR